MEHWQQILLLAGGTSVAVSGILGYGVFSPRSCMWGNVHCRGSGERPAVSLTFDDGPTAGATERILDSLDELRVKAAFFVIGQNARRWPDLVRRMDAGGHIVANHSFNHPHFGLCSGTRYWRRQLDETDDVIAQIIGKRSAFFRPPMGIKTHLILGVAARSGHKVITWTRRAVDGLGTSSKGQILGKMALARAGDILLLHDGVDPNIRRAIYHDRSATCAAVTPLVENLRSRGLELVRLDQLLGLEPYAMGETVVAG